MLKHLIIALLIIGFTSCKKEKTIYNYFTEKELDFVSYADGQDLKIIDSAGVTHELWQSLYNREFSKLRNGWFDRTTKFREQYEVGFNSVTNSPFLSIRLYLYSEFLGYTPGQIAIAVNEYKSDTQARSLSAPASEITINAVNYKNVYRFKAYKDGIRVNNADTATIYWNKQNGFIQLLFPNGKAFTRTD